jgi:hypothetical protein
MWARVRRPRAGGTGWGFYRTATDVVVVTMWDARGLQWACGAIGVRRFIVKLHLLHVTLASKDRASTIHGGL